MNGHRIICKRVQYNYMDDTWTIQITVLCVVELSELDIALWSMKCFTCLEVWDSSSWSHCGIFYIHNYIRSGWSNSLFSIIYMVKYATIMNESLPDSKHFAIICLKWVQCASLYTPSDWTRGITWQNPVNSIGPRTRSLRPTPHNVMGTPITCPYTYIPFTF